LAGVPEVTLTSAAGRLERAGKVQRRSSLYRTTPVGYAAQPDFVNAVVELETELGPQELLGELMAIEQEFGRERAGAIKDGPRTLDLDLLLYGEQAIREPELVVPHPRLTERAFVLIPLCEIAPGVIPAGQTLTAAQALSRIQPKREGDAETVRRIPWGEWDHWRP
jgi:2-amino-4-hydroxy-6-hydroxymethyldihydropteridine diphosphokinase